MTRAIDVLMRFAKGLSTTDLDIPDEVRAGAAAAVGMAASLRSESAIVYVGTETVDGAEVDKYFGSLEAVRGWIKQQDGRRYRTADLNF